MRALVHRLRSRGRRLSDRDVANSPGTRGELQTAQVHRGTVTYAVATLADPDNQVAAHLTPDLFEPVLVFIGVGGFVLRGYEKDQNRAVLQEWRCEFET